MPDVHATETRIFLIEKEIRAILSVLGVGVRKFTRLRFQRIEIKEI